MFFNCLSKSIADDCFHSFHFSMFFQNEREKVLSFPALYALYFLVLLELSLFVHFIAFCFYTIKVQKMCRGISGKTLYLHTLFFYHYQFNTYPKRYE